MASWSSRRKFEYGLIIIICLIFLISIPLFLIFYKTPTCTDGVMNGKETGIDCGGACIRLCQNSFLPPRVVWGGAKFEKIANGLYNVASLIENQNVNGAAIDVPYRISLYDDKGISITEKEGKVTLYAHRNSLAFDTAVDVGKRIPAKAFFEFTKDPIWFKSHDALEGIAIVDKKYSEDEISSSLEVIIENRTLFSYKDIIVSVVLYDINGNAIGFSRTIIDSIEPRNGREVASFTWPTGRNGKVTSIEVIPIITPVSDR